VTVVSPQLQKIVAVAVAVAEVIFLGHGHGDDHDCDHQPVLRLGATIFLERRLFLPPSALSPCLPPAGTDAST